MPLDGFPFIDLVRRHQRFVLTTHVRPDGDGLGLMLALADVLEAPPLSKTVRMAVASVQPPRYDFLDPLLAESAAQAEELAVDAGYEERLAKQQAKESAQRTLFAE